MSAESRSRERRSGRSQPGWCHSCQSQVQAIMNESEEAECQTCHATFVELTNPSAGEDAGLRMFLGTSPSTWREASSSNEARGGGGSASGLRATRSTTGGTGGRTPGAELVASAIQQFLSAPQAAAASGEQPAVGALVTGGGDLLGALQPLLALPVRSEGGASLLGDYAVGNISNLIDQIMANDPSSQPPAPASKSAVQRLCTTIDIAQSHVDDGWECAIHKEPFGLGEVATRLPCGHVFLEDAILRWLDDHHSCPVCRFALPTDDQEADSQAAAAAAAAAEAATRQAS